jgi:hypothetical protein
MPAVPFDRRRCARRPLLAVRVRVVDYRSALATTWKPIPYGRQRDSAAARIIESRTVRSTKAEHMDPGFYNSAV